MDDPRFEPLKGLFLTAASEHHRAFVETDGADPEWPLWYAGFLREKLEDLLGAKFTTSELVYLLVLVDKEQHSRTPEAGWEASYARFFLERYGGSLT